MKIHYFIKHRSTGNILVIKENGVYDVPYINCDVDDVKTLITYLNAITNWGFMNRDFETYSGGDKDNRYYFCLHSILDKHAKLLVKNYEWLSDKDIVEKINKDNASEFMLELKESITHPLTEEEIHELFDKAEKNEKIKKLAIAINMVNKQKIEKLKNLPIGYLTEDEAKAIDRYDAWHRVLMAVFDEVRKNHPTGIKTKQFEDELKQQSQKELTPKIVVDVYKKYQDAEDEIIRQIIKRNS